MSLDKFNNKYRIQSSRLQNWDYAWNGKYSITICTANREHYFGKIRNGKMQFSEIGKLAEKFMKEIPNHFPFVILDEFIVMPNHIHCILIIDKMINVASTQTMGHTTAVETRQCLVSEFNPANITINVDALTPGQKRFQNQGKNTVSSIIGSFKSVVTKHAHEIDIDFGWQSRFHDHIIRDKKELNRLRKYIKDNPINWDDDEFN